MKSIQLVDYQEERNRDFCRGMIHIGEEIEKKVKELKISAVELARMISTTKQNMYQIFKKKSIDTDQLQQISKALNFNFFDVYKRELATYVEEPVAIYQNKLDVIRTKATLLAGQNVVILRKDKHFVGQIFSIEKRNKSSQGDLEFIDVLPQKYFSSQQHKDQYLELRNDPQKEEVFRLTYCEQIALSDIIDLAKLDDIHPFFEKRKN